MTNAVAKRPHPRAEEARQVVEECKRELDKAGTPYKTIIATIWPDFTPVAYDDVEETPEPVRTKISLPLRPKPKPAEKTPPKKPIILATMDAIGTGGVDAIAKHSGLTREQISPRMGELVSSGELFLTGKQVLSDSGVPQNEYSRVAPAGPQLEQETVPPAGE